MRRAYRGDPAGIADAAAEQLADERDARDRVEADRAAVGELVRQPASGDAEVAVIADRAPFAGSDDERAERRLAGAEQIFLAAGGRP